MVVEVVVVVVVVVVLPDSPRCAAYTVQAGVAFRFSFCNCFSVENCFMRPCVFQAGVGLWYSKVADCKSLAGDIGPKNVLERLICTLANLVRFRTFHSTLHCPERVQMHYCHDRYGFAALCGPCCLYLRSANTFFRMQKGPRKAPSSQDISKSARYSNCARGRAVLGLHPRRGVWHCDGRMCCKLGCLNAL